MKIKLLPKNLRIPKKACKRCNLYRSRTYICHGTGPGLSGGLVFVGEGPGYEEDVTGIVFCGRAGQYLNDILKMLKVSRNKVNCLNILKCRPPENRDPAPNEVEKCLPYLHKQIEIIEPKLVVALGKVACVHLAGFGESVVQNHGNLYSYLENEDVDVMYTYHPAFIIRPYGNKYKSEFVRDINNALKYVGLK